MNDSKTTKQDSDRLVAPLKVAVWVAVLAVIVLAVEAPHSGRSLYAPDEMTSVPASTSSTSDTEYFPARFPPPKAEPEPVAPTF
jgi:hypothetical protein